MPVIQIKIMIIENYLAPWFQERITGVICSYNRKNKVQIRMLQSLKLQTRRTCTTAIFVRTMWTIEILRIRQSELQFAYSGNTRKELCMRNMSLLHRLTQLPLYRFLSYDFFE